MSWVLAVDLGNGGPKVAAVSAADSESGRILATAFIPVSVHHGLDGTATQDAREWEVALREAVARVVADVPFDELVAVGITGQWSSTVPVDADGDPAGPVILWSDTRSRGNVRRQLGGPVRVGGYAPHKVLPWIRIAGGAPSPSGADPTGHALLLQNELSDVGARTRLLLEPVDYLGFLLTGAAVATPASMTGSWLTDNRIGAPPGYVEDLVRRSGRDPALLPQLVPTGSIQGTLQPGPAARLGLKAGVPVACGIPDIHAAVVGSGAVAPFQTHLAISTTAWFSAPVPFKRTDVLHSIATLPGLTPDLNIVGNNIETGGEALSWLRGILSDGSGGDLGYDDLTALAGRAPAGCEGLIFTPWLAGERSPVEDKHLRAAFLNLSLRTDRAMLARAVLEGVALNIGWLFGYYEKFLRRRVPSIRILGGGAQSDLWCSIIASVLDRPVERVADPWNAQLRGVALWALVCAGRMTLAEAASRVPVAAVFAPDPAERAVYARHLAEYRKLYRTVKGFYRRMNG
ncbi:MAG: carbohydrate kinase [Mycobacterium sp.]|nr:carbohydrate kinase [Mycobacterium sp.]